MLYIVLNNSLFRAIKKNPKMGFDDDFKMIADVTVNSKAEVQLEIDNIAKWAKDHDRPLSIEKSSVRHCGKKQPYNEYTLGQIVNKSVDSMIDLGILRTADASYIPTTVKRLLPKLAELLVHYGTPFDHETVI